MIIEHLANSAVCVVAALAEMAAEADKKPLTPRLKKVNEHLGRVLSEFKEIDRLLDQKDE
jgi:hypothetical protein